MKDESEQQVRNKSQVENIQSVMVSLIFSVDATFISRRNITEIAFTHIFVHNICLGTYRQWL